MTERMKRTNSTAEKKKRKMERREEKKHYLTYERIGRGAHTSTHTCTCMKSYISYNTANMMHAYTCSEYSVCISNMKIKFKMK